MNDNDIHQGQHLNRARTNYTYSSDQNSTWYWSFTALLSGSSEIKFYLSEKLKTFYLNPGRFLNPMPTTTSPRGLRWKYKISKPTQERKGRRKMKFSKITSYYFWAKIKLRCVGGYEMITENIFSLYSVYCINLFVSCSHFLSSL